MESNGFIAAAAILTPIFAGVVVVLNALHKNAQERRATQFTEQGIIIDRQEKQIARLEAQITKQQEAIEEIGAAHGRCREETASLRMYLTMLHDYAQRQYAALLKVGISTEPPPPLPPLREQPDQVEYVTKDTGQTTRLLTAVDDKLLDRGKEGGS
jgi:uncharacterized coiled-coil protein SlyX